MKPKPKKKQPSEASLLMWEHLSELCLERRRGACVKELKFHNVRKWKFDFGIELHPKMIGIEIEGGAWISGRHNRGAGFIKDMEKYNHATLLGWRVLRFTPQQVLDGSAIEFIKKVLES